ncbi:MAG TPA: type II secretion system protein [Candidatus Paceibacterota bacterium]
MKHFLYTKTQPGFTIIETMIATSLFLVVMVIGVGSLLNANSISHKNTDERTVLDNVSFALEEMSRNLRTGYSYHCELNGDALVAPEKAQSCDLGYLIAFEDTHGSPDDVNDQWVYKIDAGTNGLNISKSIDSGVSWVELVSAPNLIIDSASGFSVLGAEPPPDDTNQPFVVIKLAGEIQGKDGNTSFSLETAVSQRLLDI